MFSAGIGESVRIVISLPDTRFWIPVKETLLMLFPIPLRITWTVPFLAGKVSVEVLVRILYWYPGVGTTKYRVIIVVNKRIVWNLEDMIDWK